MSSRLYDWEESVRIKRNMLYMLPSSTVSEFKIGGVDITTSLAENPWLINFFFNQDIIQKPCIVGLTVCDYTPGSISHLQLCIGNRRLMIGLWHLKYEIPSSLKEFLADEQICFVGVNMKDILATLEKEHKLTFGTNNWKDLGALVPTPATTTSIDKKNEEKPKDELIIWLAREFGGGLNLERTIDLKCSGWSVDIILTTEQIYYATLDVYAAYLIGVRVGLSHMNRSIRSSMCPTMIGAVGRPSLGRVCIGHKPSPTVERIGPCRTPPSPIQVKSKRSQPKLGFPWDYLMHKSPLHVKQQEAARRRRRRRF